MSKPRKMPNEDIIRRQAKEIRELRELCSEMYQVVGQFVAYDDDDSLKLSKLLDTLSMAANGEGVHPKQSVLPWHLPDDLIQAMERFTALKKLEKLHVADA
jgi:hypothetical protein